MLPVVTLTGPPFQRGQAHGRAARDRIDRNLTAYFARFAREAGLGADEVRVRAAAYWDLVRTEHPAYAEEMRGVADGAGVDLLAIVALNVRYEILYDAFARQAVGAAGAPGSELRADGCTAFAVQPAASADGHLLLAQNWDWFPEVQGLVLRRVAGGAGMPAEGDAPAGGGARPDADGTNGRGAPGAAGDPESLCFTEAGIVGGKLGLNAAGLGLAINGLISEGDDAGRLATPFHVRCHEILRQRGFDAAVAVVAAGRRACSANFLIAQVDDRVADIEAAPGAVRTLAPEGGVIAHTNHFLDAAALGIVEPVTDTRPFSVHRQVRCATLLRERDAGGVTIAAAMAFLRDHDGHPQSLCRHRDARRPPERQSTTVASALMDLHAGRMWISDGPPCENPYQALALGGG